MSAEHRAPSGAERRAAAETEHRARGAAERRSPGEADHRSPGEADHRTPGGRGTAGGQETPSGHESPEELTVRDPVSAPDAEGRPRRVTRRFPLFTRDTARPEGGGRAAAGDAPAPARQWPVLAVLGLAGLGLLVTAFGQFRIGTLLIGVALLGGGAMRWLLPGVGMLAVRSRFTDIVTYGLLGTVIVLLALMAQPNPLLQIPFLKDTLHFTVTSE
ncbi:hypothetical protein BJ965_002982 [Streptomyces luteogriseus]|uniref:DUF3017 domain-containing protein n=1 Tax=Streptomyces luteogriseus TaxID=68233 RepID=A0A7W7DNJ2_9ACTN|nr:DUF3017 domain-containing protein [Streptomyces luteogriseus]MBB4713100.1 hypothetical protein [Streptomyces luteogriseus]